MIRIFVFLILLSATSWAGTPRTAVDKSTAYITEAFLRNSNTEVLFIYSFANEKGFGERILFDNSGLHLADAQYRFVRDVTYEMSHERADTLSRRLGVRSISDRIDMEVNKGQLQIQIQAIICDTTDTEQPILRTGLPDGRACASYLPEVSWKAPVTAALWAKADSVYHKRGKAMVDSVVKAQAKMEAEAAALRNEIPSE